MATRNVTYFFPIFQATYDRVTEADLIATVEEQALYLNKVDSSLEETEQIDNGGIYKEIDGVLTLVETNI